MAISVPINASDSPREHSHDVVLPAMTKRTMWGAVMAGALSAISTQFVFTVLGIAMGLSIADGNERASDVGLSAGLWWLITGTLSLLIGGFVLGRVGGMIRSADLLLHAFVMWAVTAVFGFAVLWGGGGTLYGAGSDAASRGFANSGAMSNMAPSVMPTPADGANATNPDAEDRRQAARTGTTPQLQDAKDKGAAAAWWSVGALTLGICASLAGAWMSAPDRIFIKPAERDNH
ncbi:MAG TPA: hypothetical protein VD971_03420 [Phycisphaerales bacterium]|nr:hypothetical protein [Phycisphaerales bacterium]